MTVTLVTGANKGLGYETARRLRGAGHTVYVGARDITRGQAAAERLDAQFVQLDVTDNASVAAAADEMMRTEGHLDVLVNNAGVFDWLMGVEGLTAERMQVEFETNVFGIVRVTQAMLPLLQASDAPVVINVSSELGSFGVVTDPARDEAAYATVIYSASKAAVSMLTVQYAKALPGIRFNVVAPGFTATDMNGGTGPQTVTEGTDAAVRLATTGLDGPTATFQNAEGPIPW
jgi:NAD(P)-dependent dehydrogenase (short-subunit alcohol dehydrogenase family)